MVDRDQTGEREAVTLLLRHLTKHGWTVRGVNNCEELILTTDD